MTRIFLLLALFPVVLLASDEEQLGYEVTYKGIFTAMESLKIADVSLITRNVTGKNRLEAELFVTSENHDIVERLYPFRYRARSLFSKGDQVACYLFDRFKKTRKTRHRIYWLGEEPDVALLGRWQPMAENAKAKRAITIKGLKTIDQLSLLHYIRQLPYANQSEFNFPVTTGKKAVSYKVRLLKTDHIELKGKYFLAWKIRIDGYEPEKGGEELMHAPVYLWLSQQPARIPLRFEHRHPIGIFVVELKAPAKGQRQMASANSHPASYH